MIIIPKNTVLHDSLTRLTGDCKILIFAGLPGVGKTLLLQQAALMAQAAGRNVYLLQWDVARMAFETPEVMACYPEVNGVTHIAIRKAVGAWARRAVAEWQRNHPDLNDVLLGEVPLVGNRLVELVQVQADAAEVALTAAHTRFVIPVPSNAVRQAIEQARHDSIAVPQHPREKSDAPPNVLQSLWHDLHRTAVEQGFADPIPPNSVPPYEATVYAQTFQHLLRHRPNELLWINDILPRHGSAYDLGGIAGELAALPEEVIVGNCCWP